MSEDVEHARHLLERERDHVIAALVSAGDEARAVASRQKVWRAEVLALLQRGSTNGVPVTEMAKALGLSRQWTSHLLALRGERDRERQLEKQTQLIRLARTAQKHPEPEGDASDA